MLTLNSPIGTNYRVDPDDLMNTKQALNRLGYYAVPPQRGIDDWADSALFDGIKKFQQDNALKVDGFMRPGGPTEQKMKIQLAANAQNQEPTQDGWKHQFGMDVGGDRELDVKGPIRIDTHNPSASLNGARYHVDWHGLDEKGNVIPEFRNAGKTPESHPGHIAPFTTLPKTFEPPYPNPNGHRVRVWYPPQAEYSTHPGRPYLNIYRQK